MFSSLVFVSSPIVKIHLYFYTSAILQFVSMKISITLLAVLVTLGAANPIISLEPQCLVEGKTCYRYGCEGLKCVVSSYIYN